MIATNESGSEVYFFSNQGQHLKTVDSLTGNSIFNFQYNVNKLIGVTDRFNNITQINSTSSGAKIISPYGHLTSVQFDQNGWVSSISNPNSETYQMKSSNLGLLLNYKKPIGRVSIHTYDSNGLLLKDESSFGDSVSLSSTTLNGITSVSAVTAMGKQDKYDISVEVGGTTQQIRNSQGLISNIIYNPLDTSTSSYPNGFKNQISHLDDVRFGNLVPFNAFISNEISNTNLIKTENRLQNVVLADSNDLLSVASLELINNIESTTSKTEKFKYVSAGRSILQTSPEGRVSRTFLNGLGVIAKTQFGNQFAQDFTYDNRGNIIQAKQGQKNYSFSYDDKGNLISIANPLGLITKYQYDNAGRPVVQVRPDGKTIKYQFDSNNNLISVVPVDKPIHKFTFDQNSELLNQYIPPILAQSSQSNTSYLYNQDRQLIKIIQPNKTIDLNYDSTSGVLNSIIAPDVRRDYYYSNQTGLLTKSTSLDNISSTFQYVGPLVNQLNTSGAINSQLNYEYNKDFIVSKRKLLGSSQEISYDYDKDELLTQAGEARLDREPSTGQVVKVIVDLTKEELQYNGYGELISSHFLFNNKPYFEYQLTRDISGRITSKTDIIKGKIKFKESYSYDNLGRLSAVNSNHHKRSIYKYDNNGNR